MVWGGGGAGGGGGRDKHVYDVTLMLRAFDKFIEQRIKIKCIINFVLSTQQL